MQFEVIYHEYDCYVYSESLTKYYNTIFNDELEKVYVEFVRVGDVNYDDYRLREEYSHRTEEDYDNYDRILQFKDGKIIKFSCSNYGRIEKVTFNCG